MKKIMLLSISLILAGCSLIRSVVVETTDNVHVTNSGDLSISCNIERLPTVPHIVEGNPDNKNIPIKL